MRINTSGQSQRHVSATVERTTCGDFVDDTLVPLLGKKVSLVFIADMKGLHLLSRHIVNVILNSIK